MLKMVEKIFVLSKCEGLVDYFYAMDLMEKHHVQSLQVGTKSDQTKLGGDDWFPESMRHRSIKLIVQMVPKLH